MDDELCIVDGMLAHPFITFAFLSFLVIGLIAIVPISNYIHTNFFIEVNHIGLVTNKWTEIQPAALCFGSKTIYKIQVNGNFTVEVSDDDYYNYIVGSSTYSWTTTEIKNSY